jgi:ribosome-associated translation inhibitor RaiA
MTPSRSRRAPARYTQRYRGSGDRAGSNGPARYGGKPFTGISDRARLDPSEGLHRQEDTMNVQVHAQGRVPSGLVDYAREKVAVALRQSGRPVLHVRLTLACAPQAVARVDVDVNGHDIHAHAGAGSLREAIDLMQDRLRIRLARTLHHS